jgi:hypothetical protein
MLRGKNANNKNGSQSNKENSTSETRRKEEKISITIKENVWWLNGKENRNGINYNYLKESCLR